MTSIIFGTSNADVLFRTINKDYIYGRGGGDVIYGGLGGAGADKPYVRSKGEADGGDGNGALYAFGEADTARECGEPGRRESGRQLRREWRARPGHETGIIARWTTE